MLDWRVPQSVRYCVDLFVRDEQIRVNTARPGIARLEQGATRRTEPVAIVCYGPSLNETWERVRDFRWIITGSGSHRFLLDRGIVPTHHVEVDPRPHKATLLGAPHPAVEYLLCSCCHPKVFEHLAGYQIKLWHAYSNEDDWLRALPPGDWAITGGANVGLRQMALARFMGFTEFHVFGMDGCEGPTGKHAAAHPNQANDYATVDYEGVTYRTTPAFLECARLTFHELDELVDCTATFYGEGLVQAMARTYIKKPAGEKPMLAIVKPHLISAEMRDLNAQLHRENVAYGVGGERHAPTVLKLCEAVKSNNVLDYGCGKGRLGRVLPFGIQEYDPAVPGKQEPPRPADLVVCTDVLEHVEPEKIAYVLQDLARCVRKLGYITIHMGPARKTYADGRNTHLIQQGRGWWEKVLAKFFTVAKVWKKGPELHVLVAPKAKAKAGAA